LFLTWKNFDLLKFGIISSRCDEQNPGQFVRTGLINSKIPRRHKKTNFNPKAAIEFLVKKIFLMIRIFPEISFEKD
jgi:hypothetical protein